MRSFFLWILILINALTFMVGCSSAPVEPNGDHYYYADGPTPADKQKLWDAMVAVLGRYFVIRESIFREGVIVATSRVTHHGNQKTRAKVTAKIMQDEEGYFQPMIRVNEQVDISSPRPLNPTGSQPQYEWIRVRNNTNLEAKLVNEINMLAYGRKGFSSEFFLGPVKSHPVETYPRKTITPIQEEEPERIYEIERVRERVIEERIEIDGGDPSSRRKPTIRVNELPENNESVETEEVADPEIETQSSNADESKTFSKDKEKSTLSK